MRASTQTFNTVPLEGNNGMDGAERVEGTQAHMIVRIPRIHYGETTCQKMWQFSSMHESFMEWRFVFSNRQERALPKKE